MKFYSLIISCLLLPMLLSAQKYATTYPKNWGQLAAIPDQFGFAGSFAGVSNNALIVAGGANFPDGGAPWTGSKKAWTDKIFVLDKPKGKWRLAGTLSQPLGYGVSITWQNKLICIGGSNANGHKSSVIAITYLNGKIKTDDLPALPQALANTCGAVVGNNVYLAGGLLKPDDKMAANIFWRLNLAKPDSGWKALPAWPGPPRMLSVGGSANGIFYLFSGTDLEDKAGTAHRKYLKDAYAYTPGKGWKKLADLPRPVVAAIPALTFNTNQLLVFGGDDGVLADSASVIKEKHPGFSDEILSYNIKLDKWTSIGKIKTRKRPDAAANPNKSLWAPVTTTSVIWNGNLVIPGGEVRPAVRTARVLTLQLKSSTKK